MSDTPPQLRVVGVGLGRTGTRSMKEALEILGFGPCHHMVSLFEDPRRVDMFLDAYAGKPVDWHKVMAGFGSTVDHPTTEFALELLDAFPDAKAILTTRDNADVWWKSLTATIYAGMRWQTRLLTLSLPSNWKFSGIGKGVGDWYRRNYGPMGPQSYEKHNARMIASIPKERLLVFNVKEGWEPLCRFLGVPVPNVPFPRLNDSKELSARIRKNQMMGVGMWVVELAVVGLLVRQAIRARVWDSLPIGNMLRLG